MRDYEKNGSGVRDKVAAEAIQAADRPPEIVSWYIRMIKELADIVDLEVVSYVKVKEKKTGRIW